MSDWIPQQKQKKNWWPIIITAVIAAIFVAIFIAPELNGSKESAPPAAEAKK